MVLGTRLERARPRVKTVLLDHFAFPSVEYRGQESNLLRSVCRTDAQPQGLPGRMNQQAQQPQHASSFSRQAQRESNPQPSDLESDALPIELCAFSAATGTRTRTPWLGTALSTLHVYLFPPWLQSAPGGSRTLTPLRASRSERDVTSIPPPEQRVAEGGTNRRPSGLQPDALRTELPSQEWGALESNQAGTRQPVYSRLRDHPSVHPR